MENLTVLCLIVSRRSQLYLTYLPKPICSLLPTPERCFISMVELTQLIFKSLTSYNLRQLCSHFLWFSSVLSRLCLSVSVSVSCTLSRETLSDQVSRRADRRLLSTAFGTERTHLQEMLAPKSFFPSPQNLHSRTLPWEGNMPESMEHLLRHWYYWDVWGSLE